jgi:hypothetical protein
MKMKSEGASIDVCFTLGFHLLEVKHRALPRLERQALLPSDPAEVGDVGSENDGRSKLEQGDSFGCPFQ